MEDKFAQELAGFRVKKLCEEQGIEKSGTVDDWISNTDLDDVLYEFGLIIEIYLDEKNKEM